MKMRGDNLDRDVSIESRVTGTIDLSHATRTQLRDDDVRTEPGARLEQPCRLVELREQPCQRCDRRIHRSRLLARRHERGDFGAKHWILGARRIEERFARLGGSRAPPPATPRSAARLPSLVRDGRASAAIQRDVAGRRDLRSSLAQLLLSQARATPQSRLTVAGEGQCASGLFDIHPREEATLDNSCQPRVERFEPR